ncbi:MAG TPA: tetratricopeptide repeat protein [Chitinophagales bacterium]|nr:tetratricopeptide repeat protein [Chitinophagales bacterium]
MKLTKLLIFLFYVSLTLIWGCSTTNHAILPTQAFLDITSHYNAYFNSNEKVKNVYKLSLESHKDKFDTVIPVFHYNDPAEFTSYAGDLDDAVKRSTLAIQLRGAANWSDDHFLLIGQAHYLKGDYDKASSSFKYITTEYKEGVDYVKVMKSLGKPVKNYVRAKKKKKKPQVKMIVNKDGTTTLEKVDNRPEFSLWLHEPARSEALLWLIKTYTRQKKYSEASTVVTYTRGDDFFYKNLDPQLDLVEADLRVSQGEYAQAIEPLEKYLKAKKVKKRKKLKVRPHFVLAQCYAAIGNNGKAIEHYKSVLKCNPNYDMEFYAKIKMAKLGRSGNNADIRKLLTKMAKDGKYKDYWDQVFYELALISIAENNLADGRKFLHKSVDNSTTNDDQKAMSYLKLAELDYNAEEYVAAKFFYDSTLTFMSKTDARFPETDERSKLLTNLVEQLNIIAGEDSLQRIANLSEADRKKLVADAVFKKEQEEEERKAAEGSGKNTVLPNQPNTNTAQLQNPLQGMSFSWYFYNSTTRATGYNDFIRKWGKRKLEENWRRKNKSSASGDDEATAPTDSVATDTKDATGNAPAGTMEEQMLASLPTSPDKLEKSNNKMIDAYYAAGTIYKDGLDNDPKATGMFEAMNSRFPKHKLLLESYYNIYLIAKHQNLPIKAEEYKNKILAEFPESVIAKILRDPNYINEAKRKEQAIDDYYQSAYNDYSNNVLDSAWYKSEMADNIFKPNPLSAKFQLLQALVLAKQNRLADYVQALNKIVNKSKDAEVKQTASTLLSNLNKSALPQIDLSKDSLRRDSLNALYGVSSGAPDTSQNELLQQLNTAKQQAAQNGAVVNVADTTGKKAPVDGKPIVTVTGDTIIKGQAPLAGGKDTVAKQPVVDNVVVEDTTSPYSRSDAAIHYFVIYIKDPTTPQSAVMSTMAKVDAYNSSVVPEKRLQGKQVLIDSKNKLINVRQFKNRDDVMAYYAQIKKQAQLFSDLKPEQYAITCISTTNFSILLSEKNIDIYNKFFNRVYKP